MNLAGDVDTIKTRLEESAVRDERIDRLEADMADVKRRLHG